MSCVICEDPEKLQIEDDFFSGKRSEHLIAKDLETNTSAVLFHMQYHTHRGKLITQMVAERDKQVKKYLEDITRLEMSEILNIVTRNYRELAYIAADLSDEYWRLKEKFGEDAIKERLAIFASLEKALNSFSKSLPDQVFEEKKSSLKEAIIESRKLIEQIRNRS